MDTQNSPMPPADDHRPYDQQDRAAEANPNPNDPAVRADKPNYGTFGVADNATPTNQDGSSTSGGRSGSNDNPDEFSEFSDREKDAQNAPDNAEDQPGHVMQNQNPELVREVQATSEDNTELRNAWAEDDPRYAGGGTHNTREEPADAKYPNNDDK